MVSLAAPPISTAPVGGVPAFGGQSPKLIGPTTQSVLANDDNFVVIPDVPVFPEHQTKAKDGRQLVFDRVALKALCDSCNRRIASTGDYATITLGHTVDPQLVREGKAKNPPTVGFAGPFKLGLFGPVGYQRWCIFARFRIFKDKAEEIRSYPRRSPELWLMDSYDQMFLDPIALLSETPRLDMGLLYSAALHAGGIDGVLVEKYAAAAPAAGNVFIPSERYQGESSMASSADEIVQAVVGALDSLDWVQWCKQQMQASAAPAAQGTAPAADVNAPPPPEAPPAADPNAAPPAPEGAAPASPEAAPEAPPAPPAAPAAAAPAAPAAPPVEKRSETEPDKNAANASPVARVPYSADDDQDDDKEDDDAPVVQEADDEEDEDDLDPEEGETVEQYRARSREHRRGRRGAKIKYSATADQAALTTAIQAALAPIVSRVDAIDQRVTSDRTGLKNIERYAMLEALKRQGYTIDVPVLAEKLRYSATGEGGVSDAEFERTIDILKKTGNRAPLDTMIPVPDTIEQYSAQPGDVKVASTDQRQTAMALCEKAAIGGQTPSYEGTLRNVVAGKSEVALIAK